MVLPSNFPAGSPEGGGGPPPLSASGACGRRVRAGERDGDRLRGEPLGDRGGDLTGDRAGGRPERDLEHLLGGERLGGDRLGDDRLGGDRLGGERRGGDLRGERLLLCGECCLGSERRGGERLLRGGGDRPPPWLRGGGERLERRSGGPLPFRGEVLERRGGGPCGGDERRLLSSLRFGGDGPRRGGGDEPRWGEGPRRRESPRRGGD
mmetsp:Transcript_63890/g.177240  ORF Transcript_63890/g.177240 Transcript_63890/m.177240 type:complete len:208 (+) Transcript_63890:488-1111(+)